MFSLIYTWSNRALCSRKRLGMRGMQRLRDSVPKASGLGCRG